MTANLTLIPDAAEMIARITSETWSLAVFVLVVLMTLFTTCVYIETLIVIIRSFEFGHRRGYVIFLAGLYPMLSMTSLLGLCVPSVSIASSFSASMYTAVSLYVMLLLIIDLFGDIDSTLGALSGQTYTLNPVPCCCCVCLPRFIVDKRNFHRFRIGVLQLIFVLLVVALIPVVVWFDELVSQTTVSLYARIALPANLIGTLSTATALLSLKILFTPTQALLHRFHLPVLFRVNTAAVILTNIQQVIFNVIVSSGAITCFAQLTCVTFLVLRFLLNFLVMFEMPLLMLLFRVMIGKWIRSGTHQQHYEKSGAADDMGLNGAYASDSQLELNNGGFKNGPNSPSQISIESV